MDVYFRLTVDPLYDFGIDEPKDLPLEVDFTCGGAIEPPLETPMMFSTNAGAGDKLPDFWDSAIPALSSTFVELLEGAGVDNLEKYPAVVTSGEDGTVWQDYYAVNILGLISCADLDKSRYSETFPGSFSFKELAIDPEAPKGALLFRLKEDPSVILIHKRVGKYIGQMDPNRALVGWKARKVIQ